MNVGKTYYERLLDYDFCKVIGKFDKDFLIIHGDRDNIVPLSYSEKAVEVYPSAELVVIIGAGHGFMDVYAQASIESASSYLNGHLIER